MIGAILSGLTGQVATFVPTDLANLELWLDASDTSKITVSGSDVTQWDDKSGNNYSFTQGTAAYRPQSGTRTQNGKNVLDFGTNDILVSTAAASTWKFLNDGTNHTILIAFKSDANNSTTRFLCSTYGVTTNGSGFSTLISTANQYTHVVTRNVVSEFAVQNTAAFTSTNFTYNTILADPDNATAADRSDIRLEQGAANKNNVNTGAISNTNPVTTFHIGDGNIGGNLAIDGMIAEIIIYKQLLSSDDLLDVQDYLKNKWGV